jgi:hypothetical protein
MSREQAMHDKNWVVVFTHDVDVPLHERTFKDKESAAAFKAEHEHGKFATVLPMKGTFTE